MPAGTGVWVVNTLPARTASTASSKRQAVVGDQPADPLEAEEPGVALVGVEDLRVDAERVERPHPTDAEQDLLAEPMLDVAAVETVGDATLLGGVLLDVGVEQVELDAAHVGPPHPCDQRARPPGRGAPGSLRTPRSPSRTGRGPGSAPAASRRC